MPERTWILASEGHWVNLAFARSIQTDVDQTPSSYWIEFGDKDGLRVTRTTEIVAAVEAYFAARVVSADAKEGSAISLEAGYEMMKGTLESISKTLVRSSDLK